jgi:hypothetical protein
MGLDNDENDDDTGNGQRGCSYDGRLSAQLAPMFPAFGDGNASQRLIPPPLTLFLDTFSFLVEHTKKNPKFAKKKKKKKKNSL